MEGHHVTERQIVNEKLLILGQQKQDVSQCLDEVLNIGRAWVIDHDKRAGSGFEEVCQLIEDTSQLVVNFCSQMAVASCNKESISRGKAAMTEAAVSISETPGRMEDSVLKQEHSNELNGLKEHMKQINEEHKKTAMEMDRRISDLEQSVHDLIKVLSDNKTNVCSEGKKRETHEDGKKRDDDLLCKLTMDVENMQGKLKELTTQTGCCWQSPENSERFKSLQEQVKSQDKKLSMLCFFEARLQELLERLPRKVTKNADDIDNLSSQQKKARDKLERLEWEMEAVQRKFDVALKKCEQTSKDVEAKERKLEELLQSSASVSLPETTSRKDWIGFAAKLSGDWLLKKNKMTFIQEGNILNFTVIFDQGFSLDPTVGKFTVPRDGVYLICLTMHQFHDGQVVLHVTKQPNRCTRAESTSVFSHKHCLLEASTSKDLGRDCLFSFMEMKGGDHLYVMVAAVKDNPLLTDSTIFSCFLLS